MVSSERDYSFTSGWKKFSEPFSFSKNFSETFWLRRKLRRTGSLNFFQTRVNTVKSLDDKPLIRSTQLHEDFYVWKPFIQTCTERSVNFFKEDLGLKLFSYAHKRNLDVLLTVAWRKKTVRNCWFQVWFFHILTLKKRTMNNCREKKTKLITSKK